MQARPTALISKIVVAGVPTEKLAIPARTMRRLMGRPTAVQYLYMDGRLRFEHITPVRAVKTITTTAAREERSKIGIPWVF
jgi:hypothetical protein